MIFPPRRPQSEAVRSDVSNLPIGIIVSPRTDT